MLAFEFPWASLFSGIFALFVFGSASAVVRIVGKRQEARTHEKAVVLAHSTELESDVKAIKVALIGDPGDGINGPRTGLVERVGRLETNVATIAQKVQV